MLILSLIINKNLTIIRTDSSKLYIKTIYEIYMSDNPKKIVIDQHNEIKLGKSQIQKMMFLMNALEKGWSVKKQNDKYIFSSYLLMVEKEMSFIAFLKFSFWTLEVVEVIWINF